MKKSPKKSAAKKGRISTTERPPRPSNFWWNLYEAADRRDFRGWFYIPQLSPTEQMNSMTYRAIAERCDWLYKNVGAVTMVIDGLSQDEVGTGLWPKWITGQDDFDKEMTDAFHFANYDPRVFSSDGQNNYYSAQLAIRRMIRLYGDCFGQFLRAGPGAINPRLHLIPGYLVENVGNEDSEKGWNRGVLTDGNGRALRYRVLQDQDDNGYQDVEADDMLHFHEPFLAGQQRGMPALGTVAKKLFRREDIYQAIANGTLSRELVAWALEVDGNVLTGGPSMPGAQTTEVKNKDGGAYTLQKLFGLDSANQSRIPKFPAGTKLRAVEANRPSTEVRTFQDDALREVAYGSSYPPEWLFYINGMGQGTVARLVVEKVRTTIALKRAFQLEPQFLQRWPVFWAWNAMIKTGRVKAKVPENWWKYKNVPPRDFTVDLRNEARIYDGRVSTNQMSIDNFFGLAGEDAADVEDENLGIISRRIQKLKGLNKASNTTFTYFDIWPRTPQAGASDVTTGIAAPDPDAGPQPKPTIKPLIP